MDGTMMDEKDIGDEYTMDVIFKNVKSIAEKYSTGHFTLMRFTTNWRASFFTPNSREGIEKMSVGKTSKEAILLAIVKLLIEEL